MNAHICRRLMLFLDGTWNEDVENQPATNIVYLRERLFWGLQNRRRLRLDADQEEFRNLPPEIKNKPMRAMIFDGFEYIVYYYRGVGTGTLKDRLRGGLFGSGLEQNIRRAYKFLCSHFRPGDEIYIFGFSRGAFTARSLCGYLSAIGLLKGGYCTEENEERAWRYYRTPPADRLSADWRYFRDQSLVHDENCTRVRALCVFDTVGARGIPVKMFWRFNRSRYEFHNAEINSTVDIRLHALSIDEPRRAFEPAIWTKPKFEILADLKSPTEQAWFPGAHGDVGGGYVQWHHKKRGLSHLALSWMIQRLQYHLMNTDKIADVPLPHNLAAQPNPKAPIPFYAEDLLETNGQIKKKIQDLTISEVQHEPGTLWRFAFLSDSCRLINQIELKDTIGIGRIPFADPFGEAIHIAAFDRLRESLGKSNRIQWWLRRSVKKHIFYYPKNLIAIVPYIASTYLKKHKIDTPWNNKHICGDIFSWKEIKVVDWSGRILDPSIREDVERLFKIIPRPAEIHAKTMPAEMFYMDRYIKKTKEAGESIAGF